jgi:hypothetical protein
VRANQGALVSGFRTISTELVAFGRTVAVPVPACSSPRASISTTPGEVHAPFGQRLLGLGVHEDPAHRGVGELEIQLEHLGVGDVDLAPRIALPPGLILQLHLEAARLVDQELVVAVRAGHGRRGGGPEGTARGEGGPT